MRRKVAFASSNLHNKRYHVALGASAAARPAMEALAQGWRTFRTTAEKLRALLCRCAAEGWARPGARRGVEKLPRRAPRGGIPF